MLILPSVITATDQITADLERNLWLCCWQFHFLGHLNNWHLLLCCVLHNLWPVRHACSPVRVCNFFYLVSKNCATFDLSHLSQLSSWILWLKSNQSDLERPLTLHGNCMWVDVWDTNLGDANPKSAQVTNLNELIRCIIAWYYWKICIFNYGTDMFNRCSISRFPTKNSYPVFP